jgi:hypothetical protein
LNTLSRFVGPILLIWIVLLSWLLREVPFRGEHWALLYAFSHADNWKEALWNVHRFECFANVRFQPLTFFPSVIVYGIFGKHFFWHYLVSGLFHLGYCYLFLKMLSLLLVERKKNVFSAYPLEAVLFTVIFFAADIIGWTFFLYIQFACLLLYGGVWLFFKGRTREAWALLILAVFFYEPIWAVGFLLLLFTVFQKRKFTKEEIFASLGLLLTGVFIWLRYTQHIAVVKAITGENPPPLLTFSPLAKFFAAGFKFTVLTTVFFWNLIVPESAVQKEIFELRLQEWLRAQPFSFSLGVFLACAIAIISLSRSKFAKNAQSIWIFFVLSIMVLFFFIAWPRTENSSYVVNQFRYAYLLMGFAVALVLGLLRTLLPGKFRVVYFSLLTVLIFLHAGRTLQHVSRVRTVMRPITSASQSIEKSGQTSGKEWLEAMTKAIAEQSIPVGQADAPFVYNANACVIQYRRWLKGNEP